MTQEEKRRLDEMFTAFSIIAEGAYVYLCNMDHDYSRWSKTAVDFFDLPGEYMDGAGDIWEEHIHPDDRDDYHRSIEKIFSGEDMGHDMQYRARTRDGSYVVCTCRGVVIKNRDGKPLYFGGSIKNHGLLSYLDTITGLRSLYGFFEDLRTMFLKQDKGIIAQIGIGDFSAFNDVYGYSFGNRILQSFARLLQKKFANLGSVYRMDGTKFAVITHTLDLEELEKIYSEIRMEVSSDFFVDNQRINLKISSGAVNVDNFDISDKTVYSCLKFAYYESKNDRMGEFYIFEDALNDDNRDMLERLNVIRNSVVEECKGFYLCYQPVVDATTQKIKGVESLIRWKNDKFGIVPPIQFIPVLEQDAVFPVLGKWILRQAMLDGKKFLEKYPDLIVNVNLSYAQLERGGFVEEVFDLLDETGFPAENLCLEITERCRLIEMALLRNIVVILKERGIRIALDDFGTGYSTIEVLRELPVDTVKIDREFVKNIETSEVDRMTVRVITDVAQIFDVETCIEGIETEGMIEAMTQYKPDYFQGYYFSKPIPFDEFMNKDF